MGQSNATDGSFDFGCCAGGNRKAQTAIAGNPVDKKVNGKNQKQTVTKQSKVAMQSTKDNKEESNKQHASPDKQQLLKKPSLNKNKKENNLLTKTGTTALQLQQSQSISNISSSILNESADSCTEKDSIYSGSYEEDEEGSNEESSQLSQNDNEELRKADTMQEHDIHDEVEEQALLAGKDDANLMLLSEYWQLEYEKELNDVTTLNLPKLQEIACLFQHSKKFIPSTTTSNNKQKGDLNLQVQNKQAAQNNAKPDGIEEKLDCILLDVDCINEREQHQKQALILSNYAIYVVSPTDFTAVQHRLGYEQIDMLFYNPDASLLLIKPILKQMEADDYKGIFIQNTLNIYIISAIGLMHFSLLHKNVALEVLTRQDHMQKQFINENLAKYKKDREEAMFDLFKEVSLKFGEKSKTESLVEVVEAHVMLLSDLKEDTVAFEEQEQNAMKIQISFVLSSLNLYFIDSTSFVLYKKIPLSQIFQILMVKGVFNQFMIKELNFEAEYVFYLNSPDLLRALQHAFANNDQKVKFRYLKKLADMEVEFQAMKQGAMKFANLTKNVNNEENFVSLISPTRSAANKRAPGVLPNLTVQTQKTVPQT